MVSSLSDVPWRRLGRGGRERSGPRGRSGASAASLWPGLVSSTADLLNLHSVSHSPRSGAPSLSKWVIFSSRRALSWHSRGDRRGWVTWNCASVPKVKGMCWGPGKPGATARLRGPRCTGRAPSAPASPAVTAGGKASEPGNQGASGNSGFGDMSFDDGRSFPHTAEKSHRRHTHRGPGASRLFLSFECPGCVWKGPGREGARQAAGRGVQGAPPTRFQMRSPPARPPAPCSRPAWSRGTRGAAGGHVLASSAPHRQPTLGPHPPPRRRVPPGPASPTPTQRSTPPGEPPGHVRPGRPLPSHAPRPPHVDPTGPLPPALHRVGGAYPHHIQHTFPKNVDLIFKSSFSPPEKNVSAQRQEPEAPDEYVAGAWGLSLALEGGEGNRGTMATARAGARGEVSLERAHTMNCNTSDRAHPALENPWLPWS